MKIAKVKVELIDHMGTDLTVVNAARVSFDKESDWVYQHPDECLGELLHDADSRLIAYLAKHNHWSPFAHTSIQLRVKAPIFVARQLAKHQVGGVWNEVSRRYVDSEPEFFFPEVWRGRPTDGAKQGSSGVVPEVTMIADSTGDMSEFWTSDETTHHIESSLELYENLLKAGVAPEQARMILPQNMMTEWYWTGSLMFCRRSQRLTRGGPEACGPAAGLPPRAAGQDDQIGRLILHGRLGTGGRVAAHQVHVRTYQGSAATPHGIATGIWRVGSVPGIGPEVVDANHARIAAAAENVDAVDH